jgi:hypothetical protein
LSFSEIRFGTTLARRARVQKDRVRENVVAQESERVGVAHALRDLYRHPFDASK